MARGRPPNDIDRFFAAREGTHIKPTYAGVPQCPKDLDEVAKKKWKEGGLYRSPYLDVVNHASKEMQKLSKSLGLDPLSRKKLGIRPARPGVPSRDRSKGPPPPPWAQESGSKPDAL